MSARGPADPRQRRLQHRPATSGRVQHRASGSSTPLRMDSNVYYVRERLLALLSAFFGGLALLLAAVGLYGVTAYSVNRRRAEIAVRLALGADPSKVVWLVFGRVAWLAGAGAVLGVLISLWATRFVRALSYTVNGRELDTLVLAVLAVIVVTGFANGFLRDGPHGSILRTFSGCSRFPSERPGYG